MKKIIGLIICSIIAAGSLTPSFAAGSAPPCKTKYPIILVHGAFFKDQNMMGINYWWGIPSALEDEGATVYVTQQDTLNSTIERAKQVANELSQLFALHPTWKKVNLIGHSQGPLDCRYLISNLSIPGKGPAKNYVASLTSISGVHRGSEVANLLWSLYTGIPILGPELGPVIADMVNAFGSIFYYNEEDQNSMALLQALTTDYMVKTFNPNVPDVSGIYYQSWAGKINYISGLNAQDVFVGPLWAMMNLLGAGDNDMIVSVNSAKWGKFRGTLTGTGSGVSHVNEINHLFGLTPGWDAPEFYVKVVSELKSLGY
jgi:triacylglycerol lipase